MWLCQKETRRYIFLGLHLTPDKTVHKKMIVWLHGSSTHQPTKPRSYLLTNIMVGLFFVPARQMFVDMSWSTLCLFPNFKLKSTLAIASFDPTKHPLTYVKSGCFKRHFPCLTCQVAFQVMKTTKEFCGFVDSLIGRMPLPPTLLQQLCAFGLLIQLCGEIYGTSTNQ